MIAMMEMAPADSRAMGEASRKKMERQFDERLVINAYLGQLEAAVGEGASSVKRSQRRGSPLRLASGVLEVDLTCGCRLEAPGSLFAHSSA
jgi:hypothetical protein